MKQFVQKLMRPHVQTAIAGLGNALALVLAMFDIINRDQAAAIFGVFAAAALVASAWYSPATNFGAENSFPKWTEGSDA